MAGHNEDNVGPHIVDRRRRVAAAGRATSTQCRGYLSVSSRWRRLELVWRRLSGVDQGGRWWFRPRIERVKRQEVAEQTINYDKTLLECVAQKTRRLTTSFCRATAATAIAAA